MNRSLKWKLAVGFVLVFFAGATTGSFAWRWHKRPWGPPRSGALAERMNERMRQELGLTPEQAKKIAPIIEQSAQKLENIRAESAKRVRETFAETHRQILPELTPEQRKKLETMQERHRRWREHHRGFSRRHSSPVESPVP